MPAAMNTVDLTVDGDGFEVHWEALLDKGWSDGLPVVPPTQERVDAMLRGRDPRQVHVTLGGDAPGAMYSLGNASTPATNVQIAANAVMAGCRPEYFPAVLASLQAVTASGNGSDFLGGAAPLLVFNGPVRHELGISSSHEMLSMVHRAGVTLLHLAPVMLQAMLYGAAPMSLHTLRRALRSLPNAGFMNLYGQTEAGATFLPRELHVLDVAGAEQVLGR